MTISAGLAGLLCGLGAHMNGERPGAPASPQPQMPLTVSLVDAPQWKHSN